MPIFSWLTAVLMGGCVYASIHFLVQYLYTRHSQSPDHSHLLFSILCALVFGFMATELIAYQVSEPLAYAQIFKWRNGIVILYAALWPWFVYKYTQVGNTTALVLFSGYMLVFLIINLVRPYGEFFSDLPVISTYTLPWGEQLAVHSTKEMTVVGLFVWAGFIAAISYTFIACYLQYKNGFQRKATMLATAMAISSLFIFENLLVRSGVIDFIYLAQFGFPAFVLIMGVALHHDEREQVSRISSIINHVPSVIYMKDVDGRYLMVNRQYKDLFNINEETVIGSTDSKLFDKDQAVSFRENDNKVIARKQTIEFEEIVPNTQGMSSVYHSVKFPLMDESGDVFAVCGVSTDITARKQIDEEIMEAEIRYRSLVESSSATPWELDLSTWCFTYVGPQALELLGYPINQWYQNDFWIQHLHPDDRDEAISYCTQATDKGDDHQFEYRMVNADGNVVWIHDYVRIVYERNMPVRLQGYMFDITASKQAQILLKQNESKYRTLFDNSGDAILLMYEDRFIDCNEKVIEMFDCRREDIVGNTPVMFSPARQYNGENSVEKALEKISLALNGEPQTFEWRHKKLNGEEFDAEVSLNQINVHGKNCLQAIVRDVSARRRGEEALRTIAKGVSAQHGENFYQQLVLSLSKLFTAKYTFISLLDENDNMSAQTLAFCIDGELHNNFNYRLEGTPCEEVLGRKICSIERDVQQAFPDSAQLKELNAESFVGIPVYTEDKHLSGLIVILDIKPMKQTEDFKPILEIFSARTSAELERMQSEQHTRKLAFTDYLTGLSNRAALHEYMSSIIKRIHIEDLSGAMLLIDLDHFKTINDGLSHDVGDNVLKLVAHRLTNLIEKQTYLARIGGDEFVAVVSWPADEDEVFTQYLKEFSESIVEQLSSPFYLDDRILNIGASVGVVLFPEHGDNEQDIMRRADMALYLAKNMGRGNVQFYEPVMQQTADERLQIERGLRHAIDNNELQLHYQPQVNEDGEFIGAEALLRWIHPEFGQVPPERFIQVAEETGLIHTIGDWVLSKVCTQLKDWRQAGIDFKGHISVNVSAWQFAGQRFVRKIIDQMMAYRLKPEQIVLEVTETALLYDVDETLEKLAELQNVGIRVALDDFGTGYSSMAYLKDMPMQILKIDKAFVNDLLSKKQNENALIEMIIAMGQRLDMDVIAEGVEDKEQRKVLSKLGCHQFQGFLFARPMPAEQLIHWIGNSVIENKSTSNISIMQ